MQEKIEGILEQCLDVTFDYPAGYEPKEAPEAWITGQAKAIAGIAKLFERKVIWEGEGKARHGSRGDKVTIRVPAPPPDGDVRALCWAEIFGDACSRIKNGQRTRVVVEEIE